MRAADYESAWRALLEGGWGDFRLPLRFYLDFEHAYPFVAETADGRIVGTSSAIQHTRTGWVGVVFVAPALRGQGLGRLLTQAALHRLHELGCRSVLLAATELGQPVYQRLGFVPQGAYSLLSRPRAGLAVPASLDARPLTPDDLDSVIRLDRHASGEDRQAAIRALAGHGWLLGSQSRPRGYALRTPWGLGPAVAFEPADGERLLDLLLAHPHPRDEVSLIVPTDNDRARAHLAGYGFDERRRLPRMVLGEPVAWQPHAIWSIFNFALG